MPRPRRYDPDDEDDYDPDEPETYPHGLYDDDDLPLVPCPYCREEIAEDVERCPHCGNYLSKEDAPPGERKSPVWVVLMLLALLAAAFWAFGG